MFPELIMGRLYNSRGMERVSYRFSEFFEISTYLEDSGTLYINDVPHSLHRGDVRFIRPGTKLRSVGDFSCYSFYFRFGENNDRYDPQLTDRILPFFHGGEEMIDDAKSIVSLFASELPGSKLKMNMLLMRLLYNCYSLSVKSQIHSPAVETCMTHLREHYREPITLETLGALTGYVPLHVLRIFKAETGKTPHEFLSEIRMTHARDKLLNTDISIAGIAWECGFQSASHFQTLFKQRFGIPPGKFRKKADAYQL